MRHANTGVFAAFLLVFLLLLAAPVLFFLYGYGFLQLPKLTSSNIVVAATAGLFFIPVFLVFLAAIVKLAAKRKRGAAVIGFKPRQEPEHYPWENVFRAAGKEEFKAAKVKVKAAFAAPKLNATALAVAAVIIAATVVFFVVVVPTAKDVFTGDGKGSNLTDLGNLSAGISDKDNVVKNESASSLFQFFKAKLSNLGKTNMTSQAEEAKAAEAKKLAEAEKAKQKQEKEAKQKERMASSFSALAVKFKAVKAAALQASAFWPFVLAGAGILVLLAGGFYVYKAKKIRPAIELLRTSAADSVEWLAVLFAAARKNIVKIIALAILVAAAIAAFVFRDWLRGKVSGLSGFPGSLPNSLFELAFAVRDFFSAYRFYIAIGVIALLVILGILFVLERKGKESETAPLKAKASKK
ncbi:hypothetical protein HYU16_03460 [Candidatus Woesearchaeota archaeon]|nr:hypothetical protein [Candidatus Woesearchaeota archaeon]